MKVKLRKPILLGGISLSMGLWVWEIIADSMVRMGEIGMLTTIGLGAALWLLQEKQNKPNLILPETINQIDVEKAINLAQLTIENLQNEVKNQPKNQLKSQDLNQLQKQLDNLKQSLNREEIQIAITGTKKVGKTTLLELLEKQNLTVDNKIKFIETEALLTQTEANDNLAYQKILASELVLFLTDEDIKESQWQIIKQLKTNASRILIIFNKKDRYIPEERALIFNQIQQRVKELISPEEVISIASAPTLKVRKHQPDGSIQEWIENLPSELENLQQILTQIISQQKQELIWATQWRKAIAIKKQAKAKLNQLRKNQAIPIIEKYQWIAAATAFTNPVAALDLLATVAINAQMLIDLSEIYQQKISLDAAKKASITIGKLMVKLGLVELSTQTISSILKTNTVTYIAGGITQGISAAYLTRIAGLSLIEYLQELDISAKTGEELNMQRLGEKLKQIFQQNQRKAFLESFVKSAFNRLSPQQSPKLIINN